MLYHTPLRNLNFLTEAKSILEPCPAASYRQKFATKREQRTKASRYLSSLNEIKCGQNRGDLRSEFYWLND